MSSAFDNPPVIDAYLENEVSCGRVAGPSSSLHPLLQICISAVLGWLQRSTSRENGTYS